MLEENLGSLYGQFDETLQKAWKKLPTTTTNLMGADTLLRQLNQLRSSGEITEEQIGSLLTRLKGIDFSYVFRYALWGGKGDAQEFAQQLLTLVQGVQRMSQLQQQIKGSKEVPEEEQEQTRQINEQLQRIRDAQTVIIDGKKWELNTTKEIKTSVDDQTSAVGRAADAVGNLALRWFDVSARISEATTKVNGIASGETLTVASGGIAFLAGGGGPRGTDVIPAFLSEGERIINAESARRFASQLTAINAGIKPVFRNEGGNVTTNIGDINVTVSGGGSSHQTARSIAVALKRELRRGTSTL